MLISAHIGNIPVEEWVPFVVPVVALYLYVRRKERRRRAAVSRLPAASAGLDEATVQFVTDAWAKSEHRGLPAACLPLLYPPGPDGMSADELAERTGLDAATVQALLTELEDHGYLELQEDDRTARQRVWLTFEGYDLFYATEAALLSRRAADEPGGEG